MPVALIGLGSNMGHREQFLCDAVAALAGQLEIVACSSLYESQPWGLPETVPPFLNAVLLVHTDRGPEALWALCMEIERALGRRRARSLDPLRPIDLDLLLYGQLILRAEHLCLPHPLMHRRRFVLVPAADVAATYRHPLLGKSVQQLLWECTDESWIRPYAQLSDGEQLCRCPRASSSKFGRE